MSYYLRLIENLNTNTMVTLAIPHIIALIGLFTCGLMLYLSILVFRANPTNSKNRFLSMFLAAEGIGSGLLYIFRIYPFPIDTLDFLFQIRYLTGSTGMMRFILYGSIFAYYTDYKISQKIRQFYASKLLYLIPFIGFLLMVGSISALGGEIDSLGDMYMLTCDGTGQGEAATYSGGEFLFNTHCPESLASIYPLSISAIGVGSLQPIHVSIISLTLLCSTVFLYRINIKNVGENSKFDADEVKAIRFGFLAKLFFMIQALVLVVFANGLVNNDGGLQGSDIIQDNLLYPALLSTTIFMNIFGSFLMGVLFAYAILKQDVLGIDEQLRKTFTGTIFAGIGAISFIAGTEIMENLAGVGWIGAVLMGTVLIAARDPIIGTISMVSNRLLPEVHTKDENAYLELYKLAMQDGNVTEKERTMLNLQAQSYGLSSKRMEYLENWHDTNPESDESE